MKFQQIYYLCYPFTPQGLLVSTDQMTYTPSSFDIILVDDDKSEQELFSMALTEVSIRHKLSFARNGEELFDLLEARNNCNNIPNVIFLDLNMPVKDGRETLAELKSSQSYKKIPVFIYSTSNSEEEVQQCYSNGANLFLTKPYNYDELVKGLRTICDLLPAFLVLPGNASTRVACL